MRTLVFPLLLALGATAVGAQRPTPPRTRADSVARARADSAAAADSIALMKALEEQKKEQRVDTLSGQGAPGNPRLLPDLSAVGDLVADFSPDRSTQEDGARLGVREVELAVQAVVDPYFRGDVFLGFSDVEGAAVEQAYLTATALPWQLEARAGRFLLPFGKQNTTHRHDLHTFEYPYVIQRLLGEEGARGTGLYASRVFSPFGFYQELILNAVDGIGEAEDLQALEPPNKLLSGLGFLARLRNYWDLDEATNVELSASAMTGRRLQPLSNSVIVNDTEVNAVVARQSTVGADFTFRWRPLQQGLYKSFILQAEVMHQINERESSLRGRIPANPVTGGPFYEGPSRDFTGGYAFARWQLTRRLYVGARGDVVRDPEDVDGRTLSAGSGYLELFPSEFSKLLAAFERRSVAGVGENRILLQATFALGPHKPHPF
jgi:hypothetical protein